MKYRRLVQGMKPVSVLALGTWQLGGEWGQVYTQKQADALFDTCRASGINLVDTAECYGDGVSERLVGKATRQDRDHWILATKFGHRFQSMGQRQQLWSARDVRTQLETSLTNLDTDRIDLYQFHSGDNIHLDNDELWTMLDKQKRSGKIRHVGVSLTSREDVRDSQISKVRAVGARCVQVLYNRLDTGAEHTVFPRCKQDNLAVLARVPLASGFLTGKFSPDTQFPPGDYRSGYPRSWLLERLAAVETIQQHEVPEGTGLAAWSLAWVMNHPQVSTVIAGARNPAQLRDNAAAVEQVWDGHPLDVNAD